MHTCSLAAAVIPLCGAYCLERVRYMNRVVTGAGRALACRSRPDLMKPVTQPATWPLACLAACSAASTRAAPARAGLAGCLLSTTAGSPFDSVKANRGVPARGQQHLTSMLLVVTPQFDSLLLVQIVTKPGKDGQECQPPAIWQLNGLPAGRHTCCGGQIIIIRVGQVVPWQRACQLP